MAIQYLHDINLNDNELQNAKLHVTGTAPTAAATPTTTTAATSMSGSGGAAGAAGRLAALTLVEATPEVGCGTA